MGAGVGNVSPRHTLPSWPMPKDPFAAYKPVSETELDSPAPQDWPAWRRSHLGQGYSPLGQINAGNVARLQLAWSQALPGGEATTEPLVRDGVLYMLGYGDAIFAFDAATGRQLWRYQRTLPKGVNPSGKKTIALYGDKLYAGTSDTHMIALDARTGRPVWDRPVTDKAGFRLVGGPLAAKGVIMTGVSGQAPGGAFITAFDSETGEKLWTFNTIAQPGTPGGDSWNGLPLDKRSGGSVWVSGSFDPVTGLALWGTAQTYDTGPLRDRNPGMNNDALYTDSTLAFEPRTGKLVWYYQHIQNDQFDFDWVFDRVGRHTRCEGQDAARRHDGRQAGPVRHARCGDGQISQQHRHGHPEFHHAGRSGDRRQDRQSRSHSGPRQGALRLPAWRRRAQLVADRVRSGHRHHLRERARRVHRHRAGGRPRLPHHRRQHELRAPAQG